MKRMRFILPMIMLLVSISIVKAEEFDTIEGNNEQQEIIEPEIKNDEQEVINIEENEEVITTGEEITDVDPVIPEEETNGEETDEDQSGVITEELPIEITDHRPQVPGEDTPVNGIEPAAKKVNVAKQNMTKEVKIYLVVVYIVIATIFIALATKGIKVFKYTQEQENKKEEPESSEIIVN